MGRKQKSNTASDSQKESPAGESGFTIWLDNDEITSTGANATT